MSKNLSATDYYNMGIDCVKNKDYQKALDYYQKAAEIEPTYRDLWFQIGWVYNLMYSEEKPSNLVDDLYDNPFGSSPETDEMGKKVFESYIREINNHPDNYEALYNLGLYYQNELNDTDKALDCYQKVIDIIPTFSYALNNMAMIYEKKGDKEKAKEFYGKAVLTDPENEQAWINFAIFSYFTKEYEKSMEYYAKAFELNQLNYEARASMLGAMESIIIKIKPDIENKNLWRKLGENFTKFSMFERALDCFKKFLMIEPYNYDVWDNIGEICIKWKDHEKFMGCFISIDDVFNDLKRITIITTSAGPLNPDVFWFIEGFTDIVILPSEGRDSDFLQKAQKLTGFNNEMVIKAMASHEENFFICWG